MSVGLDLGVPLVTDQDRDGPASSTKILEQRRAAKAAADQAEAEAALVQRGKCAAKTDARLDLMFGKSLEAGQAMARLNAAEAKANSEAIA